MAVYTSVTKYAAKQRQRTQAVRRVMDFKSREEAQDAADQYWAVALALTAGGLPKEYLAAIGHPYRRRPLITKELIGFRPTRQSLMRGKFDFKPIFRRTHTLTKRQREYRKGFGTPSLLPINRQTGQLQDALIVYVQLGSFGRYYLRLRDNAPYALFQIDPLGRGTSTMKPRGFWKALLRFKPERSGKLLVAKREAESL